MKIKSLALILLIVLLTSSIFACSAQNKGSQNYDLSDKANEYISSENENGAPIDSSKIDSNEKIIKTVTLSLETKKFDDAVKLLDQFILENDGYVASSNISGSSYSQSTYSNARTATFTIRIPAESLDVYIGSVSSNFNVVDKKENAQNISDTYYDTEARLNSYKLQEERLLDMLSKSSTLDYMIQLESRLADVRYNIESLTATIRRYDNLVSYSTVNITLREVLDYTNTEPPQTFFDRMGVAFTEGWKGFAVAMGDFLVGVTYALPVLTILAILVVAITLIVRKTSISRRQKHDELYNNTKQVDENNTKH